MKIRKLTILSISASIMALYNSCAFANVNCDPSALTYDHQACARKTDVFTLYANNDLVDTPDDITTPSTSEKKLTQPQPAPKKKDLSKSLDEKLKKLDMSRRARKKEDLGLHVTGDKNGGSSNLNNRGMETQVEKSNKVQGEPVLLAPTKERKKAFVGVRVPIETSKRK